MARVFTAALLCLACAAKLVTIHNDVPRVDQYGHIVNAHDGSVVNFNGTWFLYGTVYENCTQRGAQCRSPCGFNPNTYALYTSPDLEAWTLHSTDIMPEVRGGFLAQRAASTTLPRSDPSANFPPFPPPSYPPSFSLAPVRRTSTTR